MRAGGGLALSALAGCGGEGAEYSRRVAETWRLGEAGSGQPAGGQALARELVRCATLAPSSHNTQCWRFRLEEKAITVLPDFTRRCPVVDPDDHHLFVSLGCAAENLMLAAAAHGLRAEASFVAAEGAFRIALSPAKVVASPLYGAIPARQSTRAEFDGKPLTAEELALLEQAVAGTGVEMLLITDGDGVEQVLEFALEANSAQVADAAFTDELESWLRFSEADALARGDGLYAASTGNPALPAWLGQPLFRLFFREGAENDKLARQVRSSAGVAVFVGPGQGPEAWLAVGRAFERFALQATVLGVRTAHLNQPVEVAEVRPDFAEALGLAGERPDLVVRFGRGPLMPRALRRPLEAVVV